MKDEIRKIPRASSTPKRMRASAATLRQSKGIRHAIKEKPEPIANEYVPTLEEQAAAQKYCARTAAVSVVPRLKVVDVNTITLDRPNEQVGLMVLAEALGVQDTNIATHLIGQLADLASHGYNIQQHELNFLLSLLKGIAPKSNIEAMLAAQMVAVHQGSMIIGQRLALSVKVPEQVILARTLSKLARTLIDLVDGFNRCRTSSETVAVQNVLVGQGGQAIVANVGPAVSETAFDKAATPPSSLAGSEKSPGTAPFKSRGKK
jgi:hypothetical protein